MLSHKNPIQSTMKICFLRLDFIKQLQHHFRTHVTQTGRYLKNTKSSCQMFALTTVNPALITPFQSNTSMQIKSTTHDIIRIICQNGFGYWRAIKYINHWWVHSENAFKLHQKFLKDIRFSWFNIKPFFCMRTPCLFMNSALQNTIINGIFHSIIKPVISPESIQIQTQKTYQ